MFNAEAVLVPSESWAGLCLTGFPSPISCPSLKSCFCISFASVCIDNRLVCKNTLSFLCISITESHSASQAIHQQPAAPHSEPSSLLVVWSWRCPARQVSGCIASFVCGLGVSFYKFSSEIDFPSCVTCKCFCFLLGKLGGIFLFLN